MRAPPREELEIPRIAVMRFTRPDSASRDFIANGSKVEMCSAFFVAILKEERIDILLIATQRGRAAALSHSAMAARELSAPGRRRNLQSVWLGDRTPLSWERDRPTIQGSFCRGVTDVGIAARRASAGHVCRRLRTSMSAAGSVSVRAVTSIWQNSKRPLPSRHSISGLY